MVWSSYKIFYKNLSRQWRAESTEIFSGYNFEIYQSCFSVIIYFLKTIISEAKISGKLCYPVYANAIPIQIWNSNMNGKTICWWCRRGTRASLAFRDHWHSGKSTVVQHRNSASLRSTCNHSSSSSCGSQLPAYRRVSTSKHKKWATVMGAHVQWKSLSRAWRATSVMGGLHNGSMSHHLIARALHLSPGVLIFVCFLVEVAQIPFM